MGSERLKRCVICSRPVKKLARYGIRSITLLNGGKVIKDGLWGILEQFKNELSPNVASRLRALAKLELDSLCEHCVLMLCDELRRTQLKMQAREVTSDTYTAPVAVRPSVPLDDIKLNLHPVDARKLKEETQWLDELLQTIHKERDLGLYDGTIDEEVEP